MFWPTHALARMVGTHWPGCSGTMMPLRRGRPHHQPWALCRIPDGRGRHSAKSVRRHPADDRGTAVAAGNIDSVKRSLRVRANLTGEVRPHREPGANGARLPKTRKRGKLANDPAAIW